MRQRTRFDIIRTLLAASFLTLGWLALLPGEAFALDTTVKYDLTANISSPMCHTANRQTACRFLHAITTTPEAMVVRNSGD
jgi:hypothetical protein